MSAEILFHIESHGLTHQGLVRPCNEDAWGQLSHKQIYLLADGMGGREGGEIAAHETLKRLSASFEKDPIFNSKETTLQVVKEALVDTIKRVNREIWELSKQDPRLKGMGTTLSCLYFYKEYSICANIGDSRIYRIREGQLLQLTHDDSLVFDLLHFGVVDEEEAKSFPLRHVITKSVGVLDGIEPVLTHSTVKVGDFFLLCSDGLSNTVSNAMILKIFTEKLSPKETAEKLVQASLNAGAPDNVTVVVVSVQSELPPAYHLMGEHSV